MNSRTLIFVPTYEEAENVGPMVEQISAAMPDADLLFCDDNSPDGTGEKLDALAARFPRLSVKHRAGKLGIGGAHLDGIAYAYEHGYDVLVTLDCDFTHSPSGIPALVSRIGEADLVIGSRYLQDNSLPGWSPLRRFLTGFGHVLTENVLGVHGDATGAFRVYNLRRIPREMFDLVTARGYAFFFQSLYIVQANGLSIVEVPITLPARTYGHSKMNIKEVARSVRQLAELTVANATRPSQFKIPKPLPELDPSLRDPQGWDAYWESKSHGSAVAYDALASVYRNVVLKRRLDEVIRQEFSPGASLVHGGCGSGQVDADLHAYANITAVDLSAAALERYRRSNPKVHALVHASIFAMPLPSGAYDGVYNLGVMEHFTGPELELIFGEFRRVLKPNGKIVLFWPHKYATSVAVLSSAHWFLRRLSEENVRLHPAEVSLVSGPEGARAILGANGFRLISYQFGAGDLFVQAVVVAERIVGSSGGL